MRRSILSVVLAVSSAALLASAPAIGSDKKQRAEPSAGRPKEVRRSVFSGNETRLAQFGWMERPCTGPVPDIHVVRKPDKGSVRFETITTAVTASRSAVQKKCFGKPVDMLAMYYRAGADVGSDKIVVDVDSKLGQVFRYVLLVDIKPGAAAERPQGAPAQQRVERAVLKGNEMRLAAPNFLNADCSSGPLPDLSVVSAPRNGTYRTEEAEIPADRPAGNVRAACNGKPVKALAIYYRPKGDFTGGDEMVVDIDYKNGTVRRFDYAITVR